MSLVNLQPMTNLQLDICVGHFNYFSRKWMWVTTIFDATFVLESILKVLVGSLQEALGRPGVWAHIISTLTKELVLCHI